MLWEKAKKTNEEKKEKIEPQKYHLGSAKNYHKISIFVLGAYETTCCDARGEKGT